MATSRPGVPYEKYLTRYANMNEARIEFTYEDTCGNQHYLCQLYSPDSLAPYDKEIYDIIHSDKAIRSRDTTSDVHQVSNVICVLHTQDTSKMDELKCTIGGARFPTPAGYINSRGVISDYRILGRRHIVMRHHADRSAYVILYKRNPYAKDEEIGMIQIGTKHCLGPPKQQIKLELSKPTGNIVKALLLAYAIKLAYTVYKIHEPLTDDCDDSDERDSDAGKKEFGGFSHFQSLVNNVPEDRKANRTVYAPTPRTHFHALRPRHTSMHTPQHTQGNSPAGQASLRLTAASEEYDKDDQPSAFANYAKKN